MMNVSLINLVSGSGFLSFSIEGVGTAAALVDALLLPYWFVV